MISFIRKVAGETVEFRSHDRIDIDEILAALLARKFGTKDFLDKYAPEERVIELGINGSPFDEHIAGRQDKTCSDLMAEALGVDSKPDLRKVLTFVRNNDKRAIGNKTWVSTVVKNLHDHVYPHAPVRVLDWASRGLEAKLLDPYNGDFSVYRIFEVMEKYPHKFQKPSEWLWIGEEAVELAQIHFRLELENIKKSGKFFQVPYGNNRCLRLAAVETESPEACKAARSLGVDVFIQRNTSGTNQIFTDKQRRIDLRDVARLLNIFEQRSEGRQKVFAPEILEQPGFAYEGGKWYFFKNGRAIFNGTLTHPAEPSLLTFEQLIGATLIALNQEKFHRDFQDDCLCGECAGEKCPYYRYWLLRCCKIRHNKQTRTRTKNKRKLQTA